MGAEAPLTAWIRFLADQSRFCALLVRQGVCRRMSRNEPDKYEWIGMLIAAVIVISILVWASHDQSRQVEKCERSGGVAIKSYPYEVSCIPGEGR